LALDVADGAGFGGFFWWEEPHLMETMRATRAGTPFADPAPLLTLVSQIVGQLILLPALASVAVAWHRLLLRDEHPGPGIYLRLDSIVVGYAILAFWIGLITLAPGYVSRMFQIVTGTSATMGDIAASVVQTLTGLISIIAFFIVARLSLALRRCRIRRRLGGQQAQHLADVLGLFFLHLPRGGDHRRDIVVAASAPRPRHRNAGFALDEPALDPRWHDQCRHAFARLPPFLRAQRVTQSVRPR
jgi:hypothetical protein